MEFIAVGLASVVLGAWLRTVPQPGRAAREATEQLLDAAQHGRLSIITSLVDAGMSVDSPGDAGETALMVAAGAGHISTVELLLSLGASVTARMQDHLGKTSSTRGLASGGGAAHAAAAAGCHEASAGPARPRTHARLGHARFQHAITDRRAPGAHEADRARRDGRLRVRLTGQLAAARRVHPRAGGCGAPLPCPGCRDRRTQ